jgi:prepilin-type N-terminal cleavage/methylation domain-containing protein
MKTKKVAAFTLSELLVVLVISSIVVALTFVVLGLIQKQISEIQRNFKDQQEIQLLERVLLQDLNKHQAFYQKDKDLLNLYSTKDSVLYQFEATCIIRNKDTFHLKVVDKQFLLDNTIAKEGWIDAIDLEFAQSYSAKNIFIYKVKDAAHYLNH